MGRIIVEVMPKPEILDPQGKAVRGALSRQGTDIFTDVRQGKRFELTVDGPEIPRHSRQLASAAGTVLSNPVIEDVVAVYERDEGKAGVVTFPGTLDDDDAARAVRLAGPRSGAAVARLGRSTRC